MKLRNQEIHLAFTNLVKLSQLKLPVNVSYGVAVLISKLKQSYSVIEGERQRLVMKYGKLNPAKNQITVAFDGENAGDFAREYGEILAKVWEDDFVFDKVILPTTITVTCENCKHKTETPLLIEPNILLPLQEKFIEVKEN